MRSKGDQLQERNKKSEKNGSQRMEAQRKRTLAFNNPISIDKSA
jgi:hypothetical protein